MRGLTTGVSVLTIPGDRALRPDLLGALAHRLRSAPSRSVGESPAAAGVTRCQRLSLQVHPACSSLVRWRASVALSCRWSPPNLYRDGVDRGRGFIGLAAMIFGNWRPGGLAGRLGTLRSHRSDPAACGWGSVHAFLLAFAVLLLLGGVYQIVKRSAYVQGGFAIVVAALTAWWYFTTDTVAAELAGTAPYVTTLLVLAFASQRLRMPAADGQIYRKGSGLTHPRSFRSCLAPYFAGTLSAHPTHPDQGDADVARRHRLGRRCELRRWPRWSVRTARIRASGRRRRHHHRRPDVCRLQCRERGIRGRALRGNAGWCRRCTWAGAGRSRLSIASARTARP